MPEKGGGSLGQHRGVRRAVSAPTVRAVRAEFFSERAVRDKILCARARYRVKFQNFQESYSFQHACAYFWRVFEVKNVWVILLDLF